MPTLPEVQTGFKNAVFTGESDVLAPHIVEAGIPAKNRLQIYQNNTRILLAEALAATFPVVEKLVGADFFAALAKVFIVAHPPANPSLLAYGAEFADFIDTVEAAASLPYLSDVARLEWAWNQAYNAADAAPLVAGDLAHLPPESLAGVHLDLHPSAFLVRSAFPVGRIWEENQSEDGGAAISLDEGAAHLMVIRPGLDVEVRFLNAAQFAFFDTLAAGRTLTQAAEAALAEDDGFDVQALMTTALADGTFAGPGDAETNDEGESR